MDWISKNHSALASLVSAVIAASVALTVFAISQYLTGKRDRIRFLTPKLEELYLLLNSVSEDNVQLFKMIYLCLEGDRNARQEFSSVSDLDLYGHKTAKRIIMYTRLYFPKLSQIHQLLFASQRDLNELVFRLHTKEPPELQAVQRASGRVAHYIRLMEQEIIRNRDYLLGDYVLPRRYAHTSKVDIETEIPPPDGPVMTRMD